MMKTMPKWSRQRKNKLLSTFEELYPDPASELNFKNNYQLLIAVVLSAQCTDKKVNDVTPILFKRYPNFKSLQAADTQELEEIIRPINYYRTKTRNIIKLADCIESRFKSRLPRTRKDLMSLSGVGQKTANVVLGELQIEPSFPVDTHVFRVSRRLGLAQEQTPEKVEEELKKHFPPGSWRNLHHWFIFHGRRVCKARNPLCKECTVSNFCIWEDKADVLKR